MLTMALVGAVAVLGGFLLGWVGRVRMREAGDAAPCPDEGSLLDLFGTTIGQLETDLRGELATAARDRAELEHRIQLMKQEWDDFYAKTRSAEERTRKQAERAEKARGNGEEADDQALLELMQTPASEEPQSLPQLFNSRRDRRAALKSWRYMHRGGNQ